MSSHSRTHRMDESGARVRLANTIVDLVEVNTAGLVVWVSYPLPQPSEWPFVLEFPGAPGAHALGRVVRCEAADSVLRVSALEGHYLLALTFVDPSVDLQSAIARMSGAKTEM
jgi:hypothetical protein